jgi:hypothetical protein
MLQCILTILISLSDNTTSPAWIMCFSLHNILNSNTDFIPQNKISDFITILNKWQNHYLLWHGAWKLRSALCWARLHWACSRGNMEGATAEHQIAGTRFHSNALHTESRWFLGSAYRNVSVHMATNLQSIVTAKNVITLPLKEVISIRFNQILPQGGKWPTEARSEVFIFRVLLLFIVTKSYSKTVLQLIVVLPGEYPINQFISSRTH